LLKKADIAVHAMWLVRPISTLGIPANDIPATFTSGPFNCTSCVKSGVLKASCGPPNSIGPPSVLCAALTTQS
jgi:hypothetical protein